MKHWIIAITPVWPGDMVFLIQFYGTTEDAKKKLMQYVNEDKTHDFAYGTESIDDIVDRKGSLWACAAYDDCTISYTATPLDNIGVDYL